MLLTSLRMNSIHFHFSLSLVPNDIFCHVSHFYFLFCIKMSKKLLSVLSSLNSMCSLCFLTSTSPLQWFFLALYLLLLFLCCFSFSDLFCFCLNSNNLWTVQFCLCSCSCFLCVWSLHLCLIHVLLCMICSTIPRQSLWYFKNIFFPIFWGPQLCFESGPLNANWIYIFLPLALILS